MRISPLFLQILEPVPVPTSYPATRSLHCARSKRWWNKEIGEKRKLLGRAKRRLRRCWREGLELELEEEEEGAVKRAGKALRNGVGGAKRRTWEDFLHRADGNNVWSVMTYTRPQRGTAVSTISHEGATTSTLEEKTDMLSKISFPAPNPYEGGEGISGPPGQAYMLIDSRMVAMAFSGTSTKKSPGPDGIFPLAIRCIYDWEPDRIEAIIRAHIRLGIHPKAWKIARGVTIPKPGKAN